MIKAITFLNQSIKYHVENENSKKTFFLFHGLGDNLTCFRNIALFLQKRKIKTVALDWPGHGENINAKVNFEDIKLLIKAVYDVEKTGKAYFIGHSLGGLAVLLALKTFSLPYENFTSIESTLTDGDKSFFKSLQDPPEGTGLENFINNDAPLQKVHFYNWQEKLRKCDLGTLKQYVSHVYLNFETYRQLTRHSTVRFDYVYGALSSNQEQRYELSENPNIIVLRLQNAFHWSHLDAQNDFFNYLETIL